jgi:hypothetical protein
MNKVPVDPFADDTDIARPVQRPTPEEVRALAESTEFRSRQSAPSPPTQSRRGKQRTGRTEQFACRITREALDTIYAIADQQRWTVGATIEHALAALQEKLRR